MDEILLPDATTHAGFLAPRDIRVGDGALDGLGELLRRWRVPTGSVLVVCDAVLPRLGHVDRATAALRRLDYQVRVFAEVSGEPELATAAAATRSVRSEETVAVVGMGGGSAMDLAKVAAALATNEGTPRDLVGTDTVRREPLPLILIPTTAGTGAEATRIAMLTDQGTKAIINDASLVPLAAVLDPALIVSLPAPVTASTGMDALSHAIESFLSTSASTLSMAAGMEAAGLLSTWLPQAYHDGGVTSRRATLYGAYLAGLALNAGVVLGHSIAYTIANRTGLPHGVTVAMALPYCIAYNAVASPDRIGHLADRIAGTEESSAPAVCARLVDLNRELAIPELADVGIGAADVPGMAAECLDRYPRPSNPEPLERDRLEVLYDHLWRATAVDAIAALS